MKKLMEHTYTNNKKLAISFKSHRHHFKKFILFIHLEKDRRIVYFVTTHFLANLNSSRVWTTFEGVLHKDLGLLPDIRLPGEDGDFTTSCWPL